MNELHLLCERGVVTITTLTRYCFLQSIIDSYFDFALDDNVSYIRRYRQTINIETKIYKSYVKKKIIEKFNQSFNQKNEKIENFHVLNVNWNKF